MSVFVHTFLSLSATGLLNIQWSLSGGKKYLGPRYIIGKLKSSVSEETPICGSKVSFSELYKGSIVFVRNIAMCLGYLNHNYSLGLMHFLRSVMYYWASTNSKITTAM